jgi:hypothetical protein
MSTYCFFVVRVVVPSVVLIIVFLECDWFEGVVEIVIDLIDSSIVQIHRKNVYSQLWVRRIRSCARREGSIPARSKTAYDDVGK